MRYWLVEGQTGLMVNMAGNVIYVFVQMDIQHSFQTNVFMECVFMPAPCFPPQYLRFSLTNTEGKVVDEWFKKKENEKSDIEGLLSSCIFGQEATKIGKCCSVNLTFNFILMLILT